jgi:hypothetical protein
MGPASQEAHRPGPWKQSNKVKIEDFNLLLSVKKLVLKWRDMKTFSLK